MRQVKKQFQLESFVCCLSVLGPPQTYLDVVYLEVEVYCVCRNLFVAGPFMPGHVIKCKSSSQNQSGSLIVFSHLNDTNDF